MKALYCAFLLFGYSCQTESLDAEVDESVPKSNQKIIPADSVNENIQYFSIGSSVIEIPTLFQLKKSNGPDFTVYYFKYPAGVGFGIFIGNFPDVPACISNFTNPRLMFSGIRDPILSQLDTSGFYTNTYAETYPYPYTYSPDFELQKSRVGVSKVPFEYMEKFHYTDTLIMEVEKIDSTIIWTSFPKYQEFGKVDILLENTRSPFGSKIHIFCTTNKYVSRKELSILSKKLIWD